MITIIKNDGNPTRPMSQPQAQSYLENVLKRTQEIGRLANLSQALNDVGSGKGKASGTLRFSGRPVLHASAGKAGKSSITILFYREGGSEFIFAVGGHLGSSSYEIDIYGQDSNPAYKLGAKLTL